MSRIPTSRLPAPSLKLPNKNLKRQLSDDVLTTSPEKKQRLVNTSSSSVNRTLSKAMPCPTKRAPKTAGGNLRRSVSMASLAPKSSGNTSRGSGFTNSIGYSSRRATNTTAVLTGLGRANGSLNAGAKLPLSNASNKQNIARNAAKTNSDNSIKEPVKGKSKRPPWDLKGRLQDMEDNFKNTCSKMSEYETRMAHNTTNENINLKSKIEELEVEKLTLEKKAKLLETELSLKTEEVNSLKATTAQLLGLKSCLEAEVSSRIQDLEEEVESQVSRNKQLTEKIIEGETSRRKLHNLVLELKGNIRVFCRVRPLLKEEIANNGGLDIIPHISFLDEKSLEVIKNPNFDGSSISGLKARNNNYEFNFDRVFSPSSSQADVFEEMSQLVQSALDGYNVCVFAYGQTGSGKTYTMEGVYNDSDSEGMIPRTVSHIFETLDDFKEKGWNYTIEASFLEIYNESIRDLLASPKDVKNINYDIKFTDGKKQDTYVTNLKVIPVESASHIYSLLSIAQKHRAVAATNMNERSSRSHSVFQLRLKGRNEKTEEACEGNLNLVDLAGSERLKDSGSEGARLTETQSINSSLANLGNVIMALGQKQNYIPYRNSKLTQLLQNSLGGNSKTLMLVNVSPLDSSLNETLNSLRFATKVNQCHIGTAVKQIKK
ncbi:Carboxy-terminal kinesin 2 [Armadillidium nasatum]|uniref:Carboxy-terminal kinesin 2 n=1 Tax=Armadillidium nasatum TaxID=96803 RepID=A0A5N5T7S7_9CRUS|nr:Carboxy-terminal kinesin 2 [Armadillidium nasatum]